MKQDCILVLDFGSQYTQLIARRLREFGIYAEIVPYFESLDSIKAKNPKGIILSGGPASVYEEGAYKPDDGVFSLGVPVLGICYGMQYIAHFFGGKVVRAQAQEFGKAVLELVESSSRADETSTTIQASFDTSELKFVSFSEKELEDVQGALVDLWEDSVRASHHFLREEDIAEIRVEVEGAFYQVANLLVATYENDFVGFIGVQDDEIPMLFVSPKYFNFGIGKALMLEALERYLKGFDTIKLDCNEQNPNALIFYQKLGFSQVARSEKDSAGRDFPILHLSVKREILLQTLKNPSQKSVKFQTSNKLFAGVKQDSIVWMSHADKVEQIPQGFVELAKSGNTHYCAIADFTRQIYALQFHPEVVHSECGGEILKNFALHICGADNSWNMKNFAEFEIAKLREKVLGVESSADKPKQSPFLAQKPTQKVLCAVSGGVDSSVVATLLYRAIGENLIPVFVDTGLLRKGEREAVEQMFRENLKVPLIVSDARELFLGRLKGVTDPEQKRKIIGETFIEVFEAEAKKHNTKGEIKFLAQGTLYPDVIESVSVKGPSKTIKSHHNVGGLPEWMRFELIEPLRELFKDEVRALGRELGMPESMLMRHPFPGPGLAIRIMGEVNSADLGLLQEADSIFIEELHKWGLYDSVWQAFCVLLNVRSVGVMGDNRTYDNTICVRAVEAMDGMTASFSHLPHEFLESVSNRIINEVEDINRVVYDITSKPPGTIEWE